MKRSLQRSILLTHLTRFSWRHVRRAPATTLSLVAVVALGVAVFYSVRLANRAAVAGFQLFTDSISGGSDFVVQSAGGTIPVDRLAELRAALNPLPALLLPVVKGTASLPNTGEDADAFDARQVPLLGIDLLAARNLTYARETPRYQPFAESDAREPSLNDPSEVYLTEAMANQLKVEAGSSVEVIVGDQLRALRVSSVMIPEAFQAGASEALMIMDLPALQSLIGMEGRIDRVEIVAPAGAGEERTRRAIEERLARLDSARWSWAETNERRESASSMTAAFRLNLTILSALSLLVGLYLIVQALEAAVVRRRAEIGVLLAMGFEPRLIRRAWLMESLLLGVIGGAIGLLLGWAMAQGAVRAVARTINALYVNTIAEAAAWNTGEALFAFFAGVGATLLAGALPARDAAATPPVQVLRKEGRAAGVRLLDAPPLGLALLVLGWICSRFPAVELAPGTRFPLGGYLAALMALVGAAILAGAALRYVPRMFRATMSRSARWRVAASQCRAPSGRQKLTVAGLVVAVGMASGMELLTHSFERSISVWIQGALRADLFVAVKGVENAANRNRISEAVWRSIQREPDVAKLEARHFFNIDFRGSPTMLMGATSTEPWTDEELIWAEFPRETVALDRDVAPGVWPALVSESFATRYRVGRDDRMRLPGPDGGREVEIVGVYADYGNERGAVLLDGDRLCEWYDDHRAVNLAVTLRPGVDAERVVARWRQTYPGLVARTQQALRDEVFTIFRQTFAVTRALKIIGVVVAVCGLALALFSLMMDRREELVAMRLLGFKRSGVMQVVALEGLFMTIVGLVGGLLLSLALGHLLIYVINKQSFGWTLAYVVPLRGMAMLSLGVVGAALLTSLGVGRWAARLKGEARE